MKRLVNIASILILILSVITIYYLFRAATPASASVAFPGFPLNQPRVISFDVNREVLADKSRREKLDQMRDWMLYTVLSESGKSVKELGEMLYDLPITRSNYMYQVGTFEYGETRSRFIGDGQVVALLPVGNTQRLDELAHVADEHRKNTGDIPKSILVFDYTLNAESLSAGEITRRDTIDGAELFTAKYGYYETNVKSLDDLKQFMQQVDDLVFAQVQSDSLKVGGRKILGHAYRGIKAEDVAAIWQSEDKIQRGEKLVDGSGFSLDPAYDFDALKKVFETYLVPYFEGTSAYEEEPKPYYRDPFKLYLSQPAANDWTSVSEALDDCNIRPFFAWLDSYRGTNPKDVEGIETLFAIGSVMSKAKNSPLPKSFLKAFITRQQARYDGDLQGTEVGMVLFYTDLIAKLWGFDYEKSTPRDIEDFKSGVEIGKHLSPAFQSTESIDNGRLWFGPDDRGYQAIEHDRLAFGRKATRLFAKSSQSIARKDEVEPRPDLAAFINWWDDHYEEIARYEPEYERLNQIMKWSLVISWLNKEKKGSYLNFLGQLQIDRGNKFPEWRKRQPNLKFNKWSDGMFLPPSNRCVKTEMLPEFSSEEFVPLGERPDSPYLLSGGVSLSSKTVFAERAVLSAETKVAQLARRSSLSYEALASREASLLTAEGRAYQFQNLAANKISIASTPRTGALLRTPYGDLATTRFQTVLSHEARTLNVAAKYGETGVGNLSIARTGNGFQIGWKARDLDLGQTLARKLSNSTTPETLLARDPLIESAIKLPGGEGYLVKVSGSENWTRLMAEGKVSGSPAKGWSARVADLQPNSKPMNLAFWDQARVDAELAEHGYVALRAEESATRGGLVEIASKVPSTGRQITIVKGDRKINAIFDPQSKSLLVKYKDLPEVIQKNPGELQRVMSRLNVEQLQREGVWRLSEASPWENVMTRDFANRDYLSLTKKLTESPANFKNVLESNLKGALKESDDLLAAGNYIQLEARLDTLIKIYGPRSDLVIRKGVSQIRGGQMRSAAETLSSNLNGLPSDARRVILDEINLRLRTSGGPGQPGLELVDADGSLSSRVSIQNLSTTSKIPGEIHSGTFYIQDSSRLNHLDWNTNFQGSLREVVSGEFGEVIKLPRGNLGSYKPTEIYVGETGMTFRTAQQTTTKANLNVPVRFGVPLHCHDDDDNNRDDCGDIYLVIERRRN